MPLGEKTLKQFGLKVTQARLEILSMFENSSVRHLSADNVFKFLQSNDKCVSISTVYRVLMQFDSCGILQKLNFGGDHSFYELNAKIHHDHVICLKCGVIEEFLDPIIEFRQHTVVASLGGKLVYHSSLLYVHCAQCLKASKKSEE